LRLHLAGENRIVSTMKEGAALRAAKTQRADRRGVEAGLGALVSVRMAMTAVTTDPNLKGPPTEAEARS
jgi:hypothetical protein